LSGGRPVPLLLADREPRAGRAADGDEQLLGDDEHAPDARLHAARQARPAAGFAGTRPPRNSLARRGSVMSAGAIAAAIYTGLSLAAGLTVLAITVVFGDYHWVARIGGAVWVFALCMIILMPTVIPLVRERIA